MLGVFMVISLLFYVWYQARVIDLGYQIQHLQKEEKNLRKTHHALLIEASHLGSLDRIEQIAKLDLGMIYPSQRNIVLVKRVPHLDPEDSQDNEITPKIWIAEGKTQSIARILW